MELSAQEKQYIKMTQTPINRLIVKLAVPTVISMLVTSLYNMADTFFVSQLGKSASGAVGVVFSLMAIIQAVGFTLGMGAGNIISRSLGDKDYDRANSFASCSFFTAIGCGILLTVFGLIFITPLMQALGATDTVVPYAETYARYILIGAPVMMCSFVMNNVLRSEGKSAFAMVGLVTGGILNMFLDPIFIFGMNMGIAGAAIATLISQCISFCILLHFFIFKKSVVTIGITRIRNYFYTLSEIIKTGAPSFCRQGLSSISTIVLNTQAGLWGGDAALSAMGIVTKIYMSMFSIGIGIGQGYQPVVGFNYGAKKWHRVKESFMFTYVAATVIMTAFGIMAFIFAPRIIPHFIDDDTVIQIGARALRYQAVAAPLLSLNVMCNMTYQSTGQKLRAILLSCCRQGVCLIPMLLILPPLFHLQGVEMSQACADLLSAAISLPCAISIVKNVNTKIAQQTI
ncbi:MAG: MATE family efflux transporter [Clostridia bacterium]|nr:MATE family efflux transporter [Clostridia bacterium]